MKRSSIISLLGFCLSVVFTFVLFVGLFTARWDYVIEHTFDTIYVLSLGLLVPISFFVGIIFFIKSILCKDKLLFIPIIVGIIAFVFNSVYYLSIVDSVIELLMIKLNIA